MQPDGKIVAGGYVKAGSSYYFALARYDADGSLDETFDSDGKVTTDLPGRYDWLEALAAQSDGKVVAVGNSGEPWMLRYEEDGSLDESFGVEGKVALDLPDPWDDVAYVADVAIQEDGKIVVAGTTDSVEEFALARYETDGSPDETFGGDGRVIGQFGNNGGVADAVTIQPDGKIVVAGEADDGHYSDAGLARYNPDGSPDTTFSDDGSMNVSPPGAGEDDRARGVVVQPNGKIVVAIGGYYGAVLRRFEADGTPDRTFGEGGTVENPDVPSYKDLIIQEDGKIVALIYRDLGRRMWGVTRYNRYGSVDRSLDFYYGWGRDEYPGASAMAMQPDGKIVLAGSLKGDDGLHDFALTRHLGASFQDNTKPTGNVTIDDGRRVTKDRTVELTLEAEDPEPNSSGVSRMRIKNPGDDWNKWTAYERSKTWRLSVGGGSKRVHVQYKDLMGNVSATASDTIRYKP